MSVSVIRRIAGPKKAVTAVALVAASAGIAMTAAPAHAAPSSASAQAIAHKMIPDAAQYKAFSNIV
ncbi:lytic transglycosylase domain-containing protein, partial [Streptomyces antibioticus]